MSTGLAVIGKILETTPIPNADRIISARVVCGRHGAWTGVVSRETEVGSLALVFLQDAILPPDPRWAFMEKVGWTVRMQRFRGAPSECLIVSDIGNLPAEIGFDATELLGVTKRQKSIPTSQGSIKGPFPSYLKKTDEVNYQKVDWQALIAGGEFYVTLKIDGTSCTAWVDETGLRVCSRNYELNEFDDKGKTNLYWVVARKYGLDAMPIGTGVQFEIAGPGVQGNPMGLEYLQGFAFNLFRLDGGRIEAEFPPYAWNFMPQAEGILAPKIRTEDDLRAFASRTYPNGKPAEGVVFSDQRKRWSFKVISLDYGE
jgi:RNA ligase (TIGR02306 family)